jgi:hypothetical protein
MDGFSWDSEIPTEEELEKRAVTKPAAPTPKVEVAEPIYQEETFIDDGQAEDLDEYELLTNARLRLEQGRLYEMFLKHNLFGDVDSDPRAIANVQRELKDFIKERLEVLLGLKPDPKLKKIHLEQSLPFNSMEIDILKKVIGRISGGATEQAEPVIKPIPKTDSLKTISSSKPSTALKPLGEPKQSVSIRKPTSPTPPTLQEPEKFERPNKPISELTRAEKEEWNRQIAKEQRERKAPPARGHTPMPSFDQQILHYGSQTNRYAQSGLVGKILQNLPNKGE